MATGPAERLQRVEERKRKVLYYLNAARRVAVDYAGGKALSEAYTSERQYRQAHLEARNKRLTAARAVDAMSDLNGSALLGWEAVLDGATTSDCRKAHGKNFRINEKPSLGYPGTVHKNCRCSVRRPWPNGQVLR